jgi:repressor LexA
MPEPLTKKQKEIYDYVCQFIDLNGYAPSFREIAEYFHYSSVATVAEFINILENKNYLCKAALKPRSLQINATSDVESYEIPLLGAIAAGAPIEAIRTNETIEIPKDMLGRKTFALKVRGNSMIDDGIFDGDYVIIEQTATARNGDIVVALLDNENVTLKRFYNEKNQIRLQPSNSALKPMRFAKGRVTIQGKVKGVIRKF